ncbi:flavodoxin I [Dysgonomonas sp. PFB1-18]|uniref:flavodoxin n=1 Tax=unclassified Dysgonomonas TaxID=2630389 RepID=UPI002475E90B|nr:MULTISPECIES: flavodoxin [unclassified Dysgonomonas]MDH6309899.1 flavodoxin I [Dysgonomonas sp. PF1-14]MDH6339443.1 flavodoxin I [Dysgonomonas sp. PF1-16]MDH6380942.1 flavodoxin I [Dysgonomonas sp. PFB1-18]MDH6397951.1 flavodoxin I [Dysgonomonas sp. PF1-23]
MSKIAIVYGSSTGATESVAEKIQASFDQAALFNAESVTIDDLKPYDFLILGASTTGVGDLQDDWEILLPKIEKMDFSGKKVAIFGLGDSASFSTSFAGGMYIIYKALKNKVEIVGSVSTDGYTFDDSEAIVNDRFVGLALDEDNEYNETESRIAAWVQELKKYLN